MQPQSPWEEVTFAVDSGATETVIKTGTLDHIPVREGEAKRKGTKYEVANGDVIPNLGEKMFLAQSEEGIQRTITAQVADVNRDLLSLSRAVRNGAQVVFHPSGSFIQDLTTQEKMWLKEESDMHTLRMWVPRPF